ncbi:response regulator [Acidobacteria bacterium AH-259-A15]|nr:response regulator [Acidobacteria bacterium AH-259-A15]
MTDSQPVKILIVDDEPHVRDILSRWLEAEGYECVTAACAEEAWKILERESFSLLVLDVMMPGKSGIELLAMTKKRWPDVAAIMVTALDDRLTAMDTLRHGAYEYVTKPYDRNKIVINVANALERRRLLLTERDYQHRLQEEVRARTADIRQREEEIVLRLVWAAESRDKATGDHIRRIGLYSASLAEALGWEPGRVEDIRLAATMHDIGKIGIPDGLLLKTDKFTAEELEVVKKHTEIGARILESSDIPLLQMAEEIVLCHHEKWDGSGYPEGLAGEEIPESARIVAIVDAYDALTELRAYHPARCEEKVLAMMTEDRGKHFDPRIFDCFLRLVPELCRIRKQVALEETDRHPTQGGYLGHSNFGPRSSYRQDHAKRGEAETEPPLRSLEGSRLTMKS